MAGDGGVGGFATELSELKRRGSGLLVVGETGDGTHLSISRRLLGRDDGATRRRVVVLTDSPATAERRIPRTAPEDAYRVIDHRPRTRSASAASGHTDRDTPLEGDDATGSDAGDDTGYGAGTPHRDAVHPTDIDRLEREILEAIEAVEPADSFEPAELRICVDSLRPLVTDDGVQAVAEFLETVLPCVRDNRGMAHAHLPVAHDAPLVGVFAPSFDAVIQLRPGEQRWHLTGKDHTTEWLPV